MSAGLGAWGSPWDDSASAAPSRDGGGRTQDEYGALIKDITARYRRRTVVPWVEFVNGGGYKFSEVRYLRVLTTLLAAVCRIYQLSSNVNMLKRMAQTLGTSSDTRTLRNQM